MSSPTRTENPATLAERPSTPHCAPPKRNKTSKKEVAGHLVIGKPTVKAPSASCPPSPNDRSRKTAVSPSRFPVFLSRDRAPQLQTPPLRHPFRRAGEPNHGLASSPRHMKKGHATQVPGPLRKTPLDQYARANGTRLAGLLPHAMQAPPSSAPSGSRRIVAFVSSEIRSSHSRLPHQGA